MVGLRLDAKSNRAAEGKGGRPSEAPLLFLQNFKLPIEVGSEAEPVQRSITRLTGQSLIDAFAEIRGLLTDEEIAQMFCRNPSTARPVDLS